MKQTVRFLLFYLVFQTGTLCAHLFRSTSLHPGILLLRRLPEYLCLVVRKAVTRLKPQWHSSLPVPPDSSNGGMAGSEICHVPFCNRSRTARCRHDNFCCGTVIFESHFCVSAEVSPDIEENNFSPLYSCAFDYTQAFIADKCRDFAVSLVCISFEEIGQFHYAGHTELIGSAFRHFPFRFGIVFHQLNFQSGSSTTVGLGSSSDSSTNMWRLPRSSFDKCIVSSCFLYYLLLIL